MMPLNQKIRMKTCLQDMLGNIVLPWQCSGAGTGGRHATCALGGRRATWTAIMWEADVPPAGGGAATAPSWASPSSFPGPFHLGLYVYMSLSFTNLWPIYVW